MKRILSTLTLAALLATPILHAEEGAKNQAAEETIPGAGSSVGAVIESSTGSAAAESAAVAASSDWQNWVFAGCILAVVTAGVIVVSLNQGHHASSH